MLECTTIILFLVPYIVEEFVPGGLIFLWFFFSLLSLFRSNDSCTQSMLNVCPVMTHRRSVEVSRQSDGRGFNENSIKKSISRRHTLL